jgi:hypothetical protein
LPTLKRRFSVFCTPQLFGRRSSYLRTLHATHRATRSSIGRFGPATFSLTAVVPAVDRLRDRVLAMASAALLVACSAMRWAFATRASCICLCSNICR